MSSIMPLMFDDTNQKWNIPFKDPKLNSYPTPAHSEYSGDSLSNRSSLGNVFEFTTAQQNTSIWSESIKSHQSLDSLSKTLISSPWSSNNLEYTAPLSTTSSTISTCSNGFTTSPTIGHARLNSTRIIDYPNANDDAFLPLTLGNNNNNYHELMSPTTALISPCATQINLERGLSDDMNELQGQFRTQLMLSINRQRQQQQQQQWSNPVFDELNHRRSPSRNSNLSCSNEQTNVKINKSLFKTEMCAKFQATGSCPYNNKCQFAHGIEELKISNKPKNWKTKMCRSWERNGYCSYGKRCCYKHGDNDDGSTLHFQNPPPEVLKI